MKAKAKALKGREKPEPGRERSPEDRGEPEPTPPEPEAGTEAQTKTLRLVGKVPPEFWNRFGTRVLPKLRSDEELKVGIDISVTVKADLAQSRESEIRQALQDLGLAEKVRIEHSYT